MQSNKENIIVDLTFAFAADSIRFCDGELNTKNRNLNYQFGKCSTSIGANVREAQNTKSKADFIHKMKIAAKEADESEYWLLLINEVYGLKQAETLLTKVDSINKVLSKIISSSKRK
jgi:four helix bundle protein